MTWWLKTIEWRSCWLRFYGFFSSIFSPGNGNYFLKTKKNRSYLSRRCKRKPRLRRFNMHISMYIFMYSWRHFWDETSFWPWISISTCNDNALYIMKHRRRCRVFRAHGAQVVIRVGVVVESDIRLRRRRQWHNRRRMRYTYKAITRHGRFAPSTGNQTTSLSSGKTSSS